MHAPDQMFCPAVVIILFLLLLLLLLLSLLLDFFLPMCVCVGACGLSLIFKLQKSIKTFNNILKLPDLYLRLSRSSFFTHFLVRDER